MPEQEEPQSRSENAWIFYLPILVVVAVLAPKIPGPSWIHFTVLIIAIVLMLGIPAVVVWRRKKN